MSEMRILDPDDPRQYVQDILANAIKADDSAKPHYINDYFISNYGKWSKQKREIVDKFCTNLCGYTLKTLIGRYNDQFK